jgi:small subunit ribosomal protein S8
MSMSDPVADMLTRIRNAHMAALEKVDIPHSKLKGEIARVLKREGYILDFAIEGGKRTLRVFLKYSSDLEPVIRGIKRVSRPGRRVFVSADDLPRVLSGLGTAILSTSSGLMTDKEARKQHVGGEVVCSVW